jgi:glutamate--cysteine ligase
VAKKFAKLLGMDPWLINPMHLHCGEVDFAASEGLDCVRGNVEVLLTKIRRKYKEYGINEKPFVVVKADAGTYGMGIMTVRDIKDLDDVNRRTRNKMSVMGRRSHRMIQEGADLRARQRCRRRAGGVYARPLRGRGFYRVHAERGIDENLSAPGSSYVPLAFARSSHLPRRGEKPGASAPNRFYMYGVIGRLAMVAASYELEATDPEAEVYA